MPEIGEIKKNPEINYKGNNKRIWVACIDCGKERWVGIRRGIPVSLRCHHCADITRGKTRRGKNHPLWKGGRIKLQGYIHIWIDKDDFFYSMADCRDYVLEHRLVIAKHLHRCLLPWEIVHHKNGTRDDNRLENLELLPGRKYHLVDSATKNEITKLQKRVILLEAEIALLKTTHMKRHSNTITLIEEMEKDAKIQG